MDLKSLVFTFSRDNRLNKLKACLEKFTEDEVRRVILLKTNGATPLVIASKNGHLEVVQFLLELGANIEETGNVQFDGETIEGSPPLWCAAAAGHYNIVKLLVENGAHVNSTTKTKSTPLRAACYDGHLEIVQYLIENGADMEIANRHGHTCLMIACYKSHFKIARYLIEFGADVNRKSIKGNTALHDCAESGSLEIMQLLLSNQAIMEMDSYGVTPLIAAALTGHSPIVELIISSPTSQLTKQDKIDALELLGATFVDKKRDMMAALEYWRRAIRERNSGSELLMKPPVLRVPNEAYAGATEIMTETQLEELFSDPDDMRMQSLLVRERILGPSHPDTSYYIRYRGAVYADTGNFDRCIKLWMYALDMQQKVLDSLNPMIQSSLISFAELFSFMMSKSVATVKFHDLFAVFQRALQQLQYSVIASASVSITPDSESSNFHRTLVIVLHFIGLLCRLQSHMKPEEEHQLKKSLYRFVKLNPRGKNGLTPLHLSCFRDSSSQTLRFPLCDFPMLEMVKLLLDVGASPNEVDFDRNTPLHIAASFKPFKKSIFKLLLEHGAHLDATNARGETPLHLYHKHSPPNVNCQLSFSSGAIGALSPPAATLSSRDQKDLLLPLKYMSLQCLAAQAVVKAKVPFHGLLPESLEMFVSNH